MISLSYNNMRLSADHSRRRESLWSSDDISHVSARRNGAVSWVPFLAVPQEVRLSRTGVLHFRWYRSDNVLPDTRSLVRTPRADDRVEHTRSTLHSPRPVDSHLWEAFLTLAEASDDEIRDFATKWGPLRHRETQPETEPLSDWRKYAKLAAAIFQCTIALKQGRAGSIKDWKLLGRWLNADLAFLRNENGLVGRMAVAQALNLWFSRTKASSLIAIQKEKLIVAPAVNSLFGIIGVQLAYQITGARQMLVCHHCHRSFTPAHKPPTGIRTFCPTCRRDKKPQLYAMRDLRDRRQQRANA
jgi:hypothetical protein